ncbi:hypothetical protein A0J57_04035 [Sphingobium sp. 22B]|uniref:SDR family NAD(P)-dependent oxidoreductase n=1 Tax=unclassified Sphingobium TaxID=2611147 RepID=UPI000784B841|nr:MULTISPECIES: glucose 1-dehydrogenase [unclassified Sphingobium]KXU33819.1 hypothetical protein AXW74_00585 [Sphingobium sp. AM]KYC33763.1 hypothetical protein A0J57_04035 [Sphingobium sp. 22B]OAP33501.1 hypothetical protein A8O16_03255 [Sphingobium sp. 20006FA]
MEQWFEGKVALVTGGGDGIGRATAHLFAQRGARVVIADLNPEKGEKVAQEIRDLGGEAAFVQTNVADRGSVDALIEATLDRFGRLDCAMNNAGITHIRDHEWDDDAFDTTIAINLKGVMNCLKAEIPAMLKSGGGTIVNTASTASFAGSRTLGVPAYVASKHGVVGLTKVAALDYAQKNIRVNAICPGVTDTAMVAQGKSLSEEIRQALDDFAPMGRMARPEEMAEAAIWLCSDKASFVTAHALVVDGGHLAA